MVEEQDLDTVFRALADPSRRAMLAALRSGEQSISELAAPLSMSFAGASKHVKVLENAGLIVRRIEGRTHACRLEAEALKRASDWLARYQVFWDDRLDILEAELIAQKKDETP